MKKILFLWIGILFAFTALSQGLIRQEIDAEKYSHAVFVPLQEKGVIAIQYYKQLRKRGWEMVMYDKNLQKIWETDLGVEEEYIPKEYIHQNDSIINLFFVDRKGKGKFLSFYIHLRDGTFQRKGFVGSKRLKFAHFDAVGSTLFTAGLVNPNGFQYAAQAIYTVTLVPIIFNHKLYTIRPQIYTYNFVTQEQKRIEPPLDGTCSIFSTFTDTTRLRYMVLIKQIKNRTCKLHWYEYDENGTELQHTILDQLNAENIISADITGNQKGEVLVIGTYNGAKNARREGVATYTDGVFISKIQDGKESFVKFHPYNQLENAYRYLSHSQMVRYQEKKRKGMRSQLGFDLNMHSEVITREDEYILVGEVYYPEYHLESHYDVRGYWMYEEVFDGYNYTHAVAISFDGQGNLKWDNIMNLENMFTFDLRENVLLHSEGDEKVMLYYNDGKIFSKGFKGSGVTFKERSDELVTVKESEAVVAERNGLIFRWYKDYFLITGYQEVESMKGKRKVFFLSKVAFQ